MSRQGKGWSWSDRYVVDGWPASVVLMISLVVRRVRSKVIILSVPFRVFRLTSVSQPLRVRHSGCQHYASVPM